MIKIDWQKSSESLFKPTIFGGGWLGLGFISPIVADYNSFGSIELYDSSQQDLDIK